MGISRKYLWAAIITGSLFVFINLWERADTVHKAANFCYFTAVLDKPKPGGGYEWQLRNKQQRIIPFRKMTRFKMADGEEEYRGFWKADICLPEAINQTTADEDPIMSGKHIFKWHTANSWRQTLEIFAPKDAPPAQLGIIYRNRKEIWRFGNEPR